MKVLFSIKNIKYNNHILFMQYIGGSLFLNLLLFLNGKQIVVDFMVSQIKIPSTYL